MDRRGFIAGLLAGFPFLGRIFSHEKRTKTRIGHIPGIELRVDDRKFVEGLRRARETLAGWKAEVDREVRAIPPGAMSLDADGHRYAWRIRVPIGELSVDDLVRLVDCVNDRPIGTVGAGCLMVGEYQGGGPFLDFNYHAIPWNRRRLPDGTWVDWRRADGSHPFPPVDFDQIPAA
jgi:hypothetical protein